MSLEEFIITVFVCVEENLAVVLGDRVLRQRGFAPALQDSEVITMLIVGEFTGHHKDKEIWQYFRHHFQDWFPGLASRTAFTTQAANLWQITENLRQHLARKLGAFRDDVHIIDGLPLPVCAFARAKRARVCAGDTTYGHCAAKKETFYGFRGHLTISVSGCITLFSLTAANIDEREAAYDITEGLSGWLLGDKGYLRPTLTEDLARQNLHLITPLRANMKESRPPAFLELLKNTRRRIETVIGQLVERFGVEQVRAKDT